MAPSAPARAVKILALVSILFSALPLRAADVSRLADFAGTYSTNGTAVVTRGKSERVMGTATMDFRIASSGKSARLKISGKFETADETVIQFSTSLILRGNKRVLITNLAPGFEDRRLAKGSYSATPSRITVSADFGFAKTSGRATVLVKLQRVRNETWLSVIQTLDTSELDLPLEWTFKALRTP